MIFVFIIMLPLFPHHSMCVANLKYFETLSHISVTSSVKRSSDGTRDLMKHVRLSAFNRNFDITLKPGTHLMAEGFQARLIHEDGSSSFFDIDQSLIFTGHLTDKPDIRVHAHTEDTLWSIQIFDKDDLFAVEPAWRLLNQAENPRNDTMIAYRASDFSSDSFDGSRFCGLRDHEETKTHHQRAESRTSTSRVGQVVYNSSHSKQGNNSRKKKSVHSGVVCTLFLVGDYTFYKGKCAGNHVICSTILFDFVKTVDTLFRNSVFEDNKFNKYTNVGLEIGQIVLYTSYTKPIKQYPHRHFNEHIIWNVNEKLDAFAMYASYVKGDRHFCANHLLTDYPFPDRILGLAWLSAICFNAIPGYQQRNSGISSGTDILRGAVTNLQMNLVFAHELGHNFGSEHDPSTRECSRPDSDGGNFLMWPYSVTGQFPNHHKFSPCSRKHIGRTIEKSNCLSAPTSVTAFCGNGIVEQGEECDAGVFGIVDTDMCCSNDCLLRPNAQCSEKNSECCKDCILAPANTLCMQRNLAVCKKASYCTGKSFTCPQPRYIADWATCRDTGQCYQGICRGFCEIKSMTEGLILTGCLCQTNENGDACKLCCFNSTDSDNPGSCVAYSNETVQDGTSCFQGFCKAGVCELNSVSTIRRLYHYLPSLNPPDLMTFMRSNIVLCVTVLSLFLWLPAVYYINKADEETEREMKRERMRTLKQLAELNKYTLLFQAEQRSTKTKRQIVTFQARNSTESDISKSPVEEAMDYVTPQKSPLLTPAPGSISRVSSGTQV